MALLPAQTITGRVTYADTGRPVPHARLEVGATHKGATQPLEYETDGEARFRAIPSPAGPYSVSPYPPEGQPYRRAVQSSTGPKGRSTSVHLALARGVVIRGRVTEAFSAKPVADARLWFTGRRSTDRSNSRNAESCSGPDGSFLLAVQAAPGYLVVEGPSDDYVLRELGQQMIKPGPAGWPARVLSTASSPATPDPAATA